MTFFFLCHRLQKTSFTVDRLNRKIFFFISKQRRLLWCCFSKTLRNDANLKLIQLYRHDTRIHNCTVRICLTVCRYFCVREAKNSFPERNVFSRPLTQTQKTMEGWNDWKFSISGFQLTLPLGIAFRCSRVGFIFRFVILLFQFKF